MTVPSALTAPQLRFVWEAVHDRYARQAADVPVHSITFTGLSRAQRDALAGLLGRSRLPGPTVTVRIDQLDRRLLDSDAAVTARQMTELLCGPIVNRPAQGGLPARPASGCGTSSSEPPTPGSPVGSTTCGSPAPEPGWPLRPEWRPTSSSPRH